MSIPTFKKLTKVSDEDKARVNEKIENLEVKEEKPSSPPKEHKEETQISKEIITTQKIESSIIPWEKLPEYDFQNLQFFKAEEKKDAKNNEYTNYKFTVDPTCEKERYLTFELAKCECIGGFREPSGKIKNHSLFILLKEGVDDININFLKAIQERVVEISKDKKTGVPKKFEDLIRFDEDKHKEGEPKTYAVFIKVLDYTYKDEKTGKETINKTKVRIPNGNGEHAELLYDDPRIKGYNLVGYPVVKLNRLTKAQQSTFELIVNTMIITGMKRFDRQDYQLVNIDKYAENLDEGMSDMIKALATKGVKFSSKKTESEIDPDLAS